MTDPLLVALENIVHDARHLSRQPDGHFVLKEKDVSASLRQLNIDCRGCGEVFAFTLDARSGNGRHIPLSEHTKKASGIAWNKVCDGVFIWRSGVRVRILVCELKSSTPTGLDWKQQLWSSSCFVRYLIEIAKQFYDIVIPDNPVFHAVAFHGGTRTMGAGKRRTGVFRGGGYPQSSLAEPSRIAVNNRGYVFLSAICH